MVEYGLLHHFVFIKVCGLATPRVNASLNYGLHGIMMCQCLFHHNKCIRDDPLWCKYLQ